MVRMSVATSPKARGAVAMRSSRRHSTLTTLNEGRAPDRGCEPNCL